MDKNADYYSCDNGPHVLGSFGYVCDDGINLFAFGFY
jgi:hypothetical protein